MCREQEHVFNARFFPRLQETLYTTLWWAKKPKRIGNLARLILEYRPRIMRLRELEAGLPEPAKVRRAGIVEEGLAWSKPAPHPLRPYLCIRAKTESDDEHYREAGQGPAGPSGSRLQMTKRRAHGCPIQADHEKCSISYLAGQFNHAWPCRQQIDRGRCRTQVPQARRCSTELGVLAGKEPPKIENRVTHDTHRRALHPDTPCRNEARGHCETCPPRRYLLQAVRKRSEKKGMTNQGAGGGWEQPKAVRVPGRERQRQVSVPAARRVVMDADSIKTSFLATGDECGEVKQRPADRNSKSDTNPIHSASSFNPMLAQYRQERTKRNRRC